MKKIDITGFKKFKINDLFDVSRPTSRTATDYLDGDIPFVSSGNFNNGVLRHFSKKENEILDKGNCITVSPLNGYAFYQKRDFLGRGGAGSAIIILRNNNLDENIGLFIASCIRKTLTSFSYNNQLTSTGIINEYIYLPADDKGKPNWQYMNSFIQNIKKECSIKLNTLKKSTTPKQNLLNVSNWKEFKLSDLFVITGSATTPVHKLKLESEGEFPYITTAATNNGICGYSDMYTEKGNVLTIDSAVLGTCFYQEKNFTASDHVEKLIPKFEMTKNIGLFMASVINANGKLLNYAYNEKRSQTALKKEKILLPVINNGQPDWNYMEDFIEKRCAICRNKIEIIKSEIEDNYMI